MKISMTILTIIITFSFGYSQSPRLIEKANKQVEKVNALIVSEAADLALNETQKADIQKLYIQKIKDIKALKKSGLEGDELKAQKKAINKKISKQIRKEILTKEQNIAFKAAKRKRKKK